MDIDTVKDFIIDNDKLLAGIGALTAIVAFFLKPIIMLISRIKLFFKLRVYNPSKKTILNTRSQYMNLLVSILRSNSSNYRAVIVGPLFLHPKWVNERRNAMSSTISYDDKLFEFVMSKCVKRNNKIRLILRNAERYKTKIDKLVLPEDRAKFIQDMIANIDSLWGENGDKGPDLVCSDVGHFRIDVIFDNAVISAARLSPERPVSGGTVSYNKDEIKIQTDTFDQVFDELSNGNAIEVEKLRNYIRDLWK